MKKIIKKGNINGTKLFWLVLYQSLEKIGINMSV